MITKNHKASRTPPKPKKRMINQTNHCARNPLQVKTKIQTNSINEFAREREGDSYIPNERVKERGGERARNRGFEKFREQPQWPSPTSWRARARVLAREGGERETMPELRARRESSSSKAREGKREREGRRCIRISFADLPPSLSAHAHTLMLAQFAINDVSTFLKRLRGRRAIIYESRCRSF